MNKSDLDAAIKVAEQLLRDGQLEDGASAYDELASMAPHEAPLILRSRSQAFASLDLLSEALDDRQRLVDLGSASASDLYFAGEYALQEGLFSRAKDFFMSAVELSLQAGDKRYLQSSRLLAALACYQLREDAACRNLLDHVDDSTEVLWLRGFDKVSKLLMLQMLEQH